MIRHIIDLIRPGADDHIIEIGPGQGALTRPLLQSVRRLDVIEIDRDLSARLQAEFKSYANLVVHTGDALRFDFRRIHHQGLRIIGNLPYNISTPLLFHLLNFIDVIDELILMLQKEVAERVSAAVDGKQYGRLSVMLQCYCTTETLLRVRPDAFRPRPHVESAIIRLKPHKPPRYRLAQRDALAIILRAAFAQRRKTLKNALKNILPDTTLTEAGIAPEKRAENLSVAEFVTLANLYHRSRASLIAAEWMSAPSVIPACLPRAAFTLPLRMPSVLHR